MTTRDSAFGPPPGPQPAGFWKRNGQQLLGGGAVTIGVGVLAWVFLTLIGLNREVGQLKSEAAALDEKIQDLKSAAGSATQQQNRQLEGLGGRLDRLDSKIDGLVASTYRSYPSDALEKRCALRTSSKTSMSRGRETEGGASPVPTIR